MKSGDGVTSQEDTFLDLQSEEPRHVNDMLREREMYFENLIQIA